MPKKMYKICEIPNYLKEFAHRITLERLEVTKDQYTTNYNKRVGIKESVLLGSVDKDYYTEYIGILGELLVRKYYDSEPSYSGYKVSAFIKSSENVSRDTDLIAYKNGQPIRVSIKSCEGGLKANKKSVDNDNADVFVFILFISQTEYAVFHFQKEYVQKWEVIIGYSPYYFKCKPKSLKLKRNENI